MQVLTKPNDEAAHAQILGYYNRIFTAKDGPLVLLSVFGIATGCTIYHQYQNGVTTLRIISLVLLLTPQVFAGVSLMPIAKSLQKCNREEQIKGLTYLLYSHIAILVSIFCFFITCLIDYNE